jgi:hypothetical protein
MKKKRKGPTAEEQRRHDDYVAKLSLVTDKSLTELTLEEFRWLAGRFFVPLGETRQSRIRREFVGSLVSEESTAFYTSTNARLAEEEDRWYVEGGPRPRLPPLPSVLDFVDAAYAKALANKTTWPVP